MEKKIEHKYRVNVLHNGKERWKYCRNINRAQTIQEVQELKNAISSVIYQKIDGKYTAVNTKSK